MKESLALGAQTITGDPAVDAMWFPRKVWPAEVVELQVYTDELGWEDAPFDPEALTVNIGDLLAHWAGAL